MHMHMCMLHVHVHVTCACACYMHIHVHAHTCTCTCHMHMCMCMCVHMCMHVHVMHMHMRMLSCCACVCMCICVCMCMCVRTQATYRLHTGHTGLHSASSHHSTPSAPRRPCCEHTRRVCHSSTGFLSEGALRVQPLPRTHRLRKASKRAVGHIPPNQFGRLAQVLCKHHVCLDEAAGLLLEPRQLPDAHACRARQRRPPRRLRLPTRALSRPRVRDRPRALARADGLLCRHHGVLLPYNPPFPKRSINLYLLSMNLSIHLTPHLCHLSANQVLRGEPLSLSLVGHRPVAVLRLRSDWGHRDDAQGLRQRGWHEGDVGRGALAHCAGRAQRHTRTSNYTIVIGTVVGDGGPPMIPTPRRIDR